MDNHHTSHRSLRRREVLNILATLGVGSAVFRRAVAQAVSSQPAVTAEMIQHAEWVAGIDLTDDQRDAAAAAVNGMLRKRDQLRAIDVDYDELPAFRFDPEMFAPAQRESAQQQPPWLKPGTPLPALPIPESADLSFLSIRQLGTWLRDRTVSSVQLTQHFLKRLRTYDSLLKCVVTLTEERALKQAETADRELAEGTDRGPLHGIPWGAKDLMAVPGYPTTWGAAQFRERQLDDAATAVRKLDDAGAVLVAKLSLGALAMGDEWFGGQTRNPWNPEQGSSGSSAGSAAAVAAGLVPFALGSETLGSIVSPSRRCGLTALRPTFGRVSRHGCMALSWTMDKIGPMARHVEDCALVLDAIHGADRNDPTSVNRWFRWPVEVDLSQLRIGRIDNNPTSKEDAAALQVLQDLGANVIDVQLPRQFPEYAISLMLDAEAATVFHDLVAADDVESLNRWPDIFRKLHFLSAVDYLHAARVRSQLMKAMSQVFETVDLYVGGGDVGLSNLTGHPTIVVPTIIEDSDHPQPRCATLTGRLYDEATLLAVGRLIELRAEVNDVHPDLINNK
ncbi:MAG: amidase [Planctomycetaceae bacterium]